MDSAQLGRKDTTKGPPLRVLCLDGGGVRGYSMLIILQELMHRVYVETEGQPPKREELPKPCEYFDLIAGTGTGGLIAIMLGRLRLDLETCMDVYVRMTKKVFETDKTIAGIPYKQTLFKASKLEEAIKSCVREHTIFEDEGNDGTATGGKEFHDISITSPSDSSATTTPVRRSMSVRSGSTVGLGTTSPIGQSTRTSTRNSVRNSAARTSAFSPSFLRWGNENASLYDGRENRTKTAVTAVYKGTNPRTGSSILLRSYDSRKEPPPEYYCTIWQAGRATCATGLAFKPIQIGQSVFTDEGAAKYNPSPQILEEAATNEWPGREIGMFVSVGTGKRPAGTSNQQHEWWEGFVGGTMGNFAEARRRLIAKIEACEDTHIQMLTTELPRRGIPLENYCRLNVEVGVGEFGMNEWDRLSEMTVSTRRYLKKSDTQKILENAAVKMAKIELMHRRWNRTLSRRYPSSSSIGQDLPLETGPTLATVPSAHEGAVELPASVGDKYMVLPEEAPPRAPDLPYEDGLVPVSTTIYTSGDPPPRPPKTPINDGAGQQHRQQYSIWPNGHTRLPPYPDTDGPPPIAHCPVSRMDEIPPEVWAAAHMLLARAEANSTDSSSSSSDEVSRPPVYKAVGITLAIASGLFIGTSFVLKKIGLLKANAKYNEEAGEGYGYLKNAFWWTGMTLMIVGEVCNFVAYAFVDAILVTPLGALSVVITTILSAIFLKERLSFVGKVGCFNCIIGSVVIVMNAPEQSSVADIQEMKHFVIAPGFLSYAGVVIVGCSIIAFFVAPKYGKKSMLVYLSICSLVGGLSVVATQGLGSAVVAQASGKPQFNQWFLYVLLVFVVATLIVEIVYLNKALNLFNAALVTPTYYVFFTSATIITSAILFQGFKGTAISIATVIMGFLVICSGVVLLQMSKSAKDVPDAAVFKGDLDQVREIAEVEEPETEPKADAIRGAAVLIRRLSQSRQKMEQEEARRLREEKMKDLLEPVRENEIVEWDGLRRRKTIIGEERGSTPVRRKTVHPPLGMSHFPEPEEDQEAQQQHDGGMGFFGSLRSRATSVLSRNGSGQNQTRARHANTDPTSESTTTSPVLPISLSDIRHHPSKADSPIVPYGPGSFEEAQEHIYGLPAGLRKEKEPDARAGEVAPQPSPRSKPLPAKPPPSPLGLGKPVQEARRQFSFNFLHRQPRTPVEGDDRPTSRPITSSSGAQQRAMKKMATEEERLGLVKGDSHSHLLSSTLHLDRDPPREPVEPSGRRPRTPSQTSSLDDYDEKLHGYQYLARPASLSDPDEDDDRQTPSPPAARLSAYDPLAMRAVTPAATRFANDSKVSAEASDAPTPLLSADATGIHAEPESSDDLDSGAYWRINIPSQQQHSVRSTTNSSIRPFPDFEDYPSPERSGSRGGRPTGATE
ncbi:hypothetical protein DV738_g2200, partial [Chaetothyriales sp. CBS 135597]